MSTLIVQVGQAGNQLGAHLWSRAVHQAQRLSVEREVSGGVVDGSSSPSLSFPSSYPSSLSQCLRWSPLFSSSGHALAVLVDTEPKVLQSISALSAEAVLRVAAPPSSAPSLFHRSALLFDQYGRGNNWSLGYAGRAVGASGDTSSSSSALMADAVLERVRACAERMDVFDSILMLHSVGGGTGSGLGSLLLERLRSEYPHHFLATASILPFQRGETPLQHYNTALCLARLHDHADAALLFHNDTTLDLLSHLVHQQQRGGKGAAPLPFAVLNSYLADCIADVLAPLTARDGDAPSATSMAALLGALCPSPRLRLLDSFTSSGLVLPTAHEPLTWAALTDGLERVTQAVMGGAAAAAIDFALIARGEASLPMEAWDRQRMDDRLGRRVRVARWNGPQGGGGADGGAAAAPRLGAARLEGRVTERLHVDSGGVSLSSQQHSLSLTLNHGRHCAYLRETLSAARAMYARRAYVHWYSRFGCGEEQFTDAFDRTQQIIDDYEQYTRD